MKALLSIFVLLFSACNDTALITKFDKNLKEIQCLNLVVFPPDKLLSSALTELYKFEEDCEYKLQVSKKSAIVCNSNQNAPRKTLSNFPSAFVRLDIYKDKKPIYSYYKDLTSAPTKEDIQRGFLRLKDDILMKK